MYVRPTCVSLLTCMTEEGILMVLYKARRRKQGARGTAAFLGGIISHAIAP